MKWVNLRPILEIRKMVSSHLLRSLSCILVLSLTHTATVSPLLRSASADWLAFPTPEHEASSENSLYLVEEKEVVVRVVVKV